MTHSITRAFITAGAVATALALSAGTASAHLTVESPGAKQGASTVLTFKVSTESDTANTTKLSIQLPGFKSARTEPLPGWTAAVEKDSSQLVTSVTWTADPGAGVGPGQFQRFVLSASPLPEENEVSFTAAQTYSDGKVVNWDQPTPDSGEEPEFPAPVLTLTEGSDAHAHGDETSSAAAEGSTTDTLARWLGAGGLALGALGVALGLGAAIRSRRK
ncbi:YcnI family protein [Antrihabitans spumae]|uniref:YcnI family protein n=1 Tax=Antrihabitans spumae TaxID=3373370 RepID=A0ABW7JXU3_9NOCA